jgi:hypothetical protein
MTQSVSPARSRLDQISSTLPTGETKAFSRLCMTCCPAASLTVRHSFTKALIVQRVLRRTVAVEVPGAAALGDASS